MHARFFLPWQWIFWVGPLTGAGSRPCTTRSSSGPSLSRTATATALLYYPRPTSSFCFVLVPDKYGSPLCISVDRRHLCYHVRAFLVCTSASSFPFLYLYTWKYIGTVAQFNGVSGPVAIHKCALLIQHTSYCKRTQHLAPLFSNSTELAALNRPWPRHSLLPKMHRALAHVPATQPTSTSAPTRRRKRSLA
jgi:hypothetical protein